MHRQVLPELLDELPPDDPRAVHSRRDLRRINKLMGNAGIMAGALIGALGALGAKGAETERRTNHARLAPTAPVLLELGGGDGTFLLELARRVAPLLGPARAILVDQQALVTADTRDGLKTISWTVETVKADVFEWLDRREAEVADVTIANLFLHHFDGDRLAALLDGISRRTRLFLACEPRRSGAALAAASMMGCIGCNTVSVHDGRISVRAGFRDHELSAIWPNAGGWMLDEKKAGPFTHGFVARREDRRV